MKVLLSHDRFGSDRFQLRVTSIKNVTVNTHFHASGTVDLILRGLTQEQLEKILSVKIENE